MTTEEAVQRWRDFAGSATCSYRGEVRTWTEHIRGRGYADEEELVQPRMFPMFARHFLDFEVGVTLAAEQAGASGQPDFTPADAVTHPFVFETKSTNLGAALAGHDDQVRRYLTESRRRINRVALTNLVGLKVFELDPVSGDLRETFAIDLRTLLQGDIQALASTSLARDWSRFLREFRHRELTTEQKLERVRSAPPWVPAFEATDPTWLSERLDRIVAVLADEVADRIAEGALNDDTVVTAEELREITLELRELEWRISDSDPSSSNRELAGFVAASGQSSAGKALRQYCAHVAYFCATRLLLVRLFEDLELLDPVLYDGGLDEWLDRLRGVVPDVIDFSFRQAQRRYPSLFDHRNTYTWYRPSRDVLIEVIYGLANTYLGGIESDVLGVVYERLLTRVDRKLLGQYYTPRDVIALIWDILEVEDDIVGAEVEEREFRVFDIATGSGGFLVEGARRMRARFEGQRLLGADRDAGSWIRNAAKGLVGVEIQRFPAYLAELNVLIQLALVASDAEWEPAIPAVGVLCYDTLALHEPDGADPDKPAPRGAPEQLRDPTRERRFEELRDPREHGTYFDVAVGNPPYVGEKAAARVIRRTRDHHPYWDRYYAQHLDYLYWFLIVGVSKLAPGGGFGFITTEYWLRASGAAPLRRFLAQHTAVDRLILFRNLRLFPDAPGQHSLVVTGRRVAAAGDLADDAPFADASFPRVSQYDGLNIERRAGILDAMRTARSAFGVRSFAATVSPNTRGSDSWADVVLTRAQLRRRARIAALGEPALEEVEEGVITGANRLTRAGSRLLSQEVAEAVNAAGQTGIFVLTPEERRGLEPLNAIERTVLRGIVNTKDVFPYAAHLPEEHNWMLYLPKPEVPADVSRPNIRDWPFPQGLPRIEAHLRRFKPLLDDKIERYNESRPWWTVHRGRPGITRHEGENPRWWDYAVTARWGGGSRLVVGLAPRDSVPADGLHVLLPSAVPAAYLVALLNSTPVQELVDTIPPGQLRKGDLVALGIPRLAEDEVTMVALEGTALADIVTDLLEDAVTWPRLPDALRADVAMREVPLGAWNPGEGPSATWGRLRNMSWVSEVAGSSARQAVREVVLEDTLLGGHIRVTGAAGGTLHVTLDRPTDELLEALVAAFRGVAASGGTLSEIAELPVPVESGELVDRRRNDVLVLEEHLDEYHAGRSRVDDVISRRLAP